MEKEDLLKIIPQRDVAPNNSESELDIALRIVSGPSAPQQQHLKDRHLNIGVVIDRSGSMNGEKLETAKKGCREIFNRMASEDRFTIIVFDDEAQVVVNPSTPRDTVTQKIDAITSGGSTNLSLGWRLGLLELQTYGTDDHVGRLILLSDGMANQGDTKVSLLGRESAQARELGITTSTVGIGEDYQEDILSAIALESGGRFFSVQQTQLEDIINEEFKGSLATRIERPRILLELPSGVEITKAFHDLKTTGGRYRIRPILDNDIFSFAVRVRILPDAVDGQKATIRAVLLDGEGIIQETCQIISLVPPQEYAKSEDNAIVQSIVEEYLMLKAEEEVIKQLDRGQFDLMATMLVERVDGMVSARDKLQEQRAVLHEIEESVDFLLEIGMNEEGIRRSRGIFLLMDFLCQVKEFGENHLYEPKMYQFLNQFRKLLVFEHSERAGDRNRRRLGDDEAGILNISEENFNELLRDAHRYLRGLVELYPNDEKLKDLYERFTNELDRPE